MTTPVGIVGDGRLAASLDEPENILVETPFGDPSDPLVRGTVAGREVVLVSRHGDDGRYPPHRVNYRANLWALRHLGARQVLAPCAVTSLCTTIGPGTVVLPDQVVDRTSGRRGTFFDIGQVRVGFAEPYCPSLRETVRKAAAAIDVSIVDGGTSVVVDGPRSPSRAEARWYAAQGWSLVDLTGQPEAALARELALCYLPVAVVTDQLAGWAEPGEQRRAAQTFTAHLDELRALLFTAALTAERAGCRCADALCGIRLPFTLL
jgi:5'-methylthioadenosine phosphorylase